MALCTCTGVENAEHYEAYKAALEGAKMLTLRYLKILFFGIPRSGKSTMRRRLVQEIINIRRHGQPSVSTGVAEACEIIIKKMTSEAVAIAGSQWYSLRKSKEGERPTKDNIYSETDIKYFAQLFYHLIYKAMPVTAHSSVSIPQSADSYTFSGSILRKSRNDAFIPAMSSVMQEGAEHGEPIEEEAQVSTDHSMAEIDKAFDDLANILRSDSPEELYLLLGVLTVINMMDVGGQPEFLDMLPALTVGAALYLLFFRLDQELHKRYPVRFHAPGSATEKTLTSSYCIEEVIHQALASIACFGHHSPIKGVADSSPSRAILVGTHKDQVTASDVAQKEKVVREMFTDAEVYKDLLLTTKIGKPFFTVDNMNGTDESEMSEIRSNIEKIIKTCFEEIPIPASWLMFRVVLHLLNQPLVTLSQCEEIARRLLMRSPVQEALWFFHHHVGSLLYYPDIPSMKDTVICTPQVIFDSISTVIIAKFEYGNYQVARKVIEQFHQTGLFTLSDISKTTEHQLSNHLSPKQLVDVLKHQNILAEVKHDEEVECCSEPTESKFIIPAALKHASEEELKPSPSLQASPLMIHFEGGFVPFGLFSASVARLIAHADSMSPKWQLCREQVKKNKVKFLVAKAFIATLVSRPQYLEIQVEQHSRARSKYTLQSICVSILEAVITTLEAVISKMKYKTYIAPHVIERPFDTAFTCCLEESHRDHLMKVEKDEGEHFCECLKEGFQVDLEEKHRYWFKQVCQSMKMYSYDIILVFYGHAWSNFHLLVQDQCIYSNDIMMACTVIIIYYSFSKALHACMLLIFSFYVFVTLNVITCYNYLESSSSLI